MTTFPDYEDDNKQSLLEKILFPGKSIDAQRLATRVNGSTILITGATYGIGAAVAEHLSNYDVTLLLLARTTEKLEAFKQRNNHKNCRIELYSIDLRSETEITNLLVKWHQQEIDIDIFISNAGKSIYRGFTDSLDRFTDTQRCAATNYTGPVQLLLGLLPGIIKRQGQIVNVSAQNVLLPPTAGWSAYQSSKVAFDQWLRCMEPELRVCNVTVSSIYLPLVRTRMSMVNEKKHKHPAMSKAKASAIILHCISKKRRIYKPWWTGVVVFFAALLPGVWYKLQVNQLKNKH